MPSVHSWGDTQTTKECPWLCSTTVAHQLNRRLESDSEANARLHATHINRLHAASRR